MGFLLAIPLRARVGLGVMAMKGFSTFFKAPAWFSVMPKTLVVGRKVFRLCKGAVNVLYSLSRQNDVKIYIYMCVCVCVVRLLADWSDTKSNVKLDGFRSQLRASYMSSHTEEL